MFTFRNIFIHNTDRQKPVISTKCFQWIVNGERHLKVQETVYILVSST